MRKALSGEKFIIGGEVCSLEVGGKPMVRPYVIADMHGRVGEFIDQTVKPIVTMPQHSWASFLFAEVFGLNIYISYNSGTCFAQFTGTESSIITLCEEGLGKQMAEKFASAYVRLDYDAVVLSFDPRDGTLRLAKGGK